METVFSEFEVEQLGLKFVDTSVYKTVDCVGTVEENMDAKTISKSCRGVVVKRIIKGTGTGLTKITAHIPYDIYEKAYGMDLSDLAEGVRAYGSNSLHKGFSMVMRIKDEDGAIKYKAYPNSVIQSGVVRKIENGAEEVAQLDLEIAIMPDDNGNGLYEAPAEEITEVLAAAWMSSFDPSLVAGSTSYAITNTLTEIQTTNQDESIISGSTYNTILVPSEGYDLPESVTVTMGGNPLVDGTDYLYSDVTGALVIINITGALVITAEGTPAA